MKLYIPNKKTFLLATLAFICLGFLAITFLAKFSVGNHGIESILKSVQLTLIFLFYFSIPAFFATLITYFLKSEVYQTWYKFAFWWTILSYLFLLLVPRDSAGGFGASTMSSQGAIAIFAWYSYIAISIVLIFVKTLTVYLRKK